MEQQKFDALIDKLEKEAEQDPRRYSFKVMLVAALGFFVLGAAVLFALFPLAALIGLGFIVVATGGKALLVLFKLGKLLILLLVPCWVMIKSSFQMLFSRFPPPEGRELKPHEAPQLFGRISELRQRTNGPAIHQVLITDELNAAIVQHPRFGLLGWERNYLILGLPLLQTLSEQEALAVIAHEYGHLCGHHSRMGGFIYRFRSTWGQLQALSEQWQDWGSRLIRKLFNKYAPYFNAYTFVYARRNEYIADSLSVELVGVKDTANALIRTQIAAQFQNDVFWPHIHKLAANQAEPINNISHFWRDSLVQELDETKRIQYFETTRQVKTNHLDTHPSLSDRLNAIGFTAETEQAKSLEPQTTTAADLWLAKCLSVIASEFDTDWQRNVTQRWLERFQHIQQQREALASLQAKETLDTNESWQVLMLQEEINPDIDISQSIEEFAAHNPEHLSARFRRGIILLNRDDEGGVADLDYVMEKDEEATPNVCEAVMHFYREKNPEQAERYRQQWETYHRYIHTINREFSSLPKDATLAAHDLDEENLQKVRNAIAGQYQHINKLYLLRRVSKHNPKLHDYVLAFATSRFTLGDKSAEVLKRLSACEFPFAAFIVNLNHSTYKGFRKQIKALSISPFYEK